MLRRVFGRGGDIDSGDPKDLRAVFREGGVPLWCILAAAALLKGIYAADYLARSPLAGGLISDALLYHDWAAAIAGGDWAGPAEPYHHPPLYPYVLSAVYRVAGSVPAAMVVLQLLLGLGTLFLCYALARRSAPRGAALLATALAALYLPMSYYETRLLPAALATFLAACALRALLLRVGAASPLALIVPGLYFGLLAAARPNQLLAVLLVLPAAALLAWRASGRTVAALSLFLAATLGAAAVPIAPFFLHNLLHGGEPVLLCDTAGVNLYFAHNPSAGVSFRTPEPELGDVAQQAAAARAIAEAAERRRLSCGEISNHFARRALRYALEHPAAEAKMLLLRAAAFFSNFEYGIEYTPAAEARATPAQKLFFLPAGVLLALAAAGAALALRGGLGPRALPLILFVLAQLATVVLFFQYSRFRVVAVPALAALAALGIGRALPLLRTARGRGLALPAAVAAGALLLAFLPPPGNANEQLANSLVTLAQGYAGRGDLARAEDELARAEELAPEIPRLPLAKYELLRARGQQAEALALLEAVAASPGPAQPVALALLARQLLKPEHRDLRRAEELARQAVRAAPGLSGGYVALALALLEQGNAEGAVAVLRPAVLLPGRDAEVAGVLGAALCRAGLLKEAEEALKQAAREAPGAIAPLDELRRLYQAQGRVAEAREMQAAIERLAGGGK